MKKISFVSLMAICLVVFFSIPQWAHADQENQDIYKKEQYGFNFGIKLFGNMGHTIGTHDVNEAHEGWNNLVSDLSALFGENVDGKLEPLSCGPYVGGELMFSFIPRFSVGIGAGFIQFTKESTVLITSEWASQEFTRIPKIRAIPITLSLYYSLPVGKIFNVTASAGVGYYLGKFFYDIYESFDDNDVSLLYEADSNTFGIHGGIDLEFNINRALALVFGVSGRCANLKDLTGNWDYTYDYSGEDQTITLTDRTLWYVEENFDFDPDSPAGKWYPTLLMYDEEPEASFYRNVRKAKVSLSSMALQIGILIRISQLFKSN